MSYNFRKFFMNENCKFLNFVLPCEIIGGFDKRCCTRIRFVWKYSLEYSFPLFEYRGNLCSSIVLDI